MMKKIPIPFNIIIVMFIVFALIGLYWLDRLGLDAGSAYLWLFVIGVVFILIAVVAYITMRNFWFEIPINKNNERGLLAFFVGTIVLLLLYMFSSLTSMNFYSPFVMAPMASFSTGIGAETFSALQASTSDFWSFFITVLSAATIEEVVLGFAFVAMGSLVLGLGLRKLLKLDFGDNGNKNWDFFMAITFSVIMFAVLHFFNGSYINADGTWNISMFIWAATFRAVLNILIYKFGNFGLLFGIGVHAVNNAIFLGSETVLKALGTFPGGIILDAIILLLIFFGFMSIRELYREGKLMGKDFITFD